MNIGEVLTKIWQSKNSLIVHTFDIYPRLKVVSMNKILFVVLVSFIFFSCSTSTPQPAQPAGSKGLIPLAVGNSWMYKKNIYDSNSNLKSTIGDTISIISHINVSGIDYYEQFQTSFPNINGASFFVNVDSNTVDKIDSATQYVFFKRVSLDNSLVDSWTDTVKSQCPGTNYLYGFTAVTNINGSDCLRNEVQVQDCTGGTFEKWEYYLKPGLGLVRIEHYLLKSENAFYLEFADDLDKYIINN